MADTIDGEEQTIIGQGINLAKFWKRKRKIPAAREIRQKSRID